MDQEFRISPSQRHELKGFPCPHIAVDVALMTIDPRGAYPRLCVLLHRRGPGHVEGMWALPGRFVRERDTLENTAQQALELKLGIRRTNVQQLHVFDDPDRDPRGWVMSVAHTGTIDWDSCVEYTHHLRDVIAAPIQDHELDIPDGQSRLPYEQREIVRYALRELRRQYALLPDPGHFLPEEFTLLQLREVHQAVQDDEIQADTFRREMKPNLIPTGNFATGGVGKPAELYRRKDRSSSTVPSLSRSTRNRRRTLADDAL